MLDSLKWLHQLTALRHRCPCPPPLSPALLWGAILAILVLLLHLLLDSVLVLDVSCDGVEVLAVVGNLKFDLHWVPIDDEIFKLVGQLDTFWYEITLPSMEVL